MRTKVELLKLLLEHFEKGETVSQTGLCLEASRLRKRGLITDLESEELWLLIRDNAPSGVYQNEHFWPWVCIVPSTKQIRIDFLKQLIRKYENYHN